jgi:predicted ATP-grasp superfamily ATP-dependent carboligase
MPLDDTRQPVEYLLSRFEVDQIVFIQNEQPNYPNRIIFQREKNDQIILIMEKDSPIPSNQQNYLQNRNRVSNTRIVRNLRYKN